jgi:hypothetical protein
LNAIHFEQFVEEVRLQHPAAQTIIATESPLQVNIDGQTYNPAAHLSRHTPFFLNAKPDLIRSDGIDYTTLTVESAFEAGKEVVLAIQQGETVLHQAIQLDETGKGHLEICTQTQGDILIWHPILPVRVQVRVQSSG